MIEKLTEALPKIENFEKKDISDIDPKMYESKKIDYEPINENKNELSTRNSQLEGKNHPETGVPFERKEVETETGEKKEGVFPVFDSEFDVQLPEELEQTKDKEQFNHCNEKLKEAVEKDSKLKEKFDDEQLEQIENGDTPDGYTWHHSEDKGKMELVDSEIHAKTGHTGGKTVWGGGSENR